MDLTLPLPRSLVLAVWLGSGGPRHRILEAVQGADSPHAVQTAEATEPLADFLDRLAGGEDELRPQRAVSIYPVPADPVLAPPAAAAAIEAGEAVVLRTHQQILALIPDVRRSDDARQPGHHVTWQVMAVPSPYGTIADRVRTVTEQSRPTLDRVTVVLQQVLLQQAAQGLRPERMAALTATVAQIQQVSRATLPARRLPSELSTWRARILTSTIRARIAVTLTSAVVGTTAVHDADQQAAALHDLDHVTRWMLTGTSTFG